MKLYLLLNTELDNATRLDPPPQAGDVVCYFRCGQDLSGEATAQLQEYGVDVVHADTLLNDADNRELDALGTDFIREWFHDGAGDFSDLDDISLGVAYSMELARQANPRIILRFGEILRRLLKRFPKTTSTLTDIRDGNGIFEVEAAYLPLNKTLAVVSSAHGLKLISLKPVDPIPPALTRVRHNNWLKTVKSLVGGWRPGWLLARLRFFGLCLRSGDRPIIYMILGRGQEPIAARLAERNNLRVVVNRQGIPGTGAMRGEQLFALPRIADISVTRALLDRLGHLSSRHSEDVRFIIEGIDYSPILFGAVRAVIASQIWSFLIVIAQSRRLHRILNYQALFVAGAGAEFMGNLVALDKSSGRSVYLMPHGMDLQRFAYLMPGSDRQHVTYLAYGADHKDFYVSDRGPGNPLRVVQTGNPLTADMNALRSKRKATHRKRLLILSFGHLEFWNAERIYAVDLYYAHLFKIARTLIEEGWQVGLRSHPSHPSDLERRLAAHFEIEGKIAWDTGHTFEVALGQYDVAVCSASTTFYQSLYAGWPTIFFEPAYRQGAKTGLENDPMMTGLVTAGDLDRPVTSDPETLETFIRSSLERDSLVSTFPARFASDLAPRFIGPRPEDATECAAEFIEQDIMGGVEAIGSDHPVLPPLPPHKLPTERSHI